MSEWRSTACILCECNCGIEVQTGGEGGRHLVKVRGDKAHPVSQGYACEKPSRLDRYQNHRDRVTSPLRRRPDGSFEEIDWDTAIREVAAKLAAIRDEHGGERIFYYGGGGQANHLPAAYARATRHTLGSRYTSNALAQEKTGEFWVNGKMFGGIVRGDFEACEVGIFIGKNPWHSHGIPRARVTLREMAKDPERSLIVIDPRRSETADIADIHLAVKPGRDAWLMAALVAMLVREGGLDEAFLAEHTLAQEEILPFFDEIDISHYCEIAGVPEEQLREVAQRITRATSVAVYEDLGVQMNRHSTLVSYLDKLIWALTGNFGKTGAQYIPSTFQALAGAPDGNRSSPVAGARIIGGLVPCNVIAEEILSDHPERYRAMWVDSANPAHSLADSKRMRAALEALELVVVVDLAMTETARLADYVLPVPTQFEKWECSFFNFEFPSNCFHLRKPLFEAPEGVLSEAEIHTRIVEALGALDGLPMEKLRAAAQEGMERYREVFFAAMNEHPTLMSVGSAVLYRTLGPRLPEGAAAAAVLWAPAQMCAMKHADSLRRAGFEGEDAGELGQALFDAILASDTGVVFSVDEADASLGRIATPEGKIQLAIPELLQELQDLADEAPPGSSPDFPFLLSAGERRSFTANTIFRDPEWRKKDREGALRISGDDADRLGLETGDLALLTTAGGAARVAVEISDRMQAGHISLPNGLGVDYPDAGGERTPTGVSPNELTSSGDRDWLAGTPWHKSVPARLESA
ncbi:MAG: molybdopterin-dependent oxidoreductase [Deltaproteobacteria bacterium]|nr:molybdopterin-dependent oxidoreductase [Deltaproteobacteria bacterium]